MNKAEIDDLESKGVERVLIEIASGKHGQETSTLRGEVEAWIRSKELESLRLNSASAEAIAAEHLRIARQQKYIAIAAMVISAITAIFAAVISAILSKT